MEIKLKSPLVKGDGTTVDTIDLNLDGLTGNDLIRAEQEARLRGNTSPNPLFSSEGLAVVAARASGINADDILSLKAPDFLQVTSAVNSFLFGWILPESLHSKISGEQS